MPADRQTINADAGDFAAGDGVNALPAYCLFLMPTVVWSKERWLQWMYVNDDYARFFRAELIAALPSAGQYEYGRQNGDDGYGDDKHGGGGGMEAG